MSAWVKIVILLLTAAIGFGAGHHVATLAATAHVAAAERDQAVSAVKSSEAARADEHKQADGFAAIDTKFSGDMRYAQALSASTVAGLHVGSIRLSRTWQCPAARPASGVPASPADPRAVATADRLRQESAGRIVRAVTELQAERDRALDKLAAERQGQ